MQTEMIVNILSSIIISIIPFVIGWITSKIKGETPQAILDLIGKRNEIVDEIKKQKENQSPDFIVDRLESLLISIDSKIEMKTKKVDGDEQESKLLIFKLLTAIEGFLFIGSFYGSPFVQKLILGLSYETNVFFLEGIFQYPIIRVILIVAFFISSFLLTIKTIRKLPPSLNSKYVVQNLILWIIFNLYFIIITFGMSFILAVLDPVIFLW